MSLNRLIHQKFAILYFNSLSIFFCSWLVILQLYIKYSGYVWFILKRYVSISYHFGVHIKYGINVKYFTILRLELLEHHNVVQLFLTKFSTVWSKNFIYKVTLKSWLADIYVHRIHRNFTAKFFIVVYVLWKRVFSHAKKLENIVYRLSTMKNFTKNCMFIKRLQSETWR